MLIKKRAIIFFVLMISSCSHKNQYEERPNFHPSSSLLQHIYYLSSDNLQGRKVGTHGSKLTQDYLVAQLLKEKIKPFGKGYLAPFSIDGVFNAIQGNNVIGLVPGTKYPDKYIVLSAHFDHLGGQGSRIYNGADDNASGTSALLHYAKLLKQSPLRYSVILLFTDGEEANLKGANAFVHQNSNLLTKIILNINIDMIAGNKKTKRLHYISRDLETLLNDEQVTAYLKQQQQAPVKIKKGFKQRGRTLYNKISWKTASDHGAFYQKKIPFIYFGVGTHCNYHKVSDIYDNINHQFFIKAVDAIYQQIIFLDRNL